jgi:hypothetical protein
MTLTAHPARHLVFATASIVLAGLIAAPARARPHIPTPTIDTQAAERSVQAGVRTASEIIAQPVHDVGLMNADIPDVLVRAGKDPYGLAVSPTCAQLRSEIETLTASIGPDFDMADSPKENRMTQLAVAGGKSVVNSFIPFRMLVREVSGAAPAQRKYQDALNVGFARRGFLKGVYRMHDCPSPQVD